MDEEEEKEPTHSELVEWVKELTTVVASLRMSVKDLQEQMDELD